MSKRLKTRVSAGAALVTGIGMMGIATATPAQAEVTGSLDYTCELVNEGLEREFDDAWTVNLTLDIPDQVEQGETIPASAIDAEVTPGEDATTAIQDFEVTSLEGEGETSYTFDEDGEERAIELTVPQTDIPSEGEFSVGATGESVEETAPDEDVNVPITAGDFKADLDDGDGFVFNIECTAPEDATVGSVAVGDVEPEEPGDGDDGGEEPGDGDEGEEPGDGDEGGEEPPAEDDGSGDDGAGDDAGEDEGAGEDAGEAEVPEVVQTDSAQAAGVDTSLALGGLLLAGAGAGAVVVARRKATQH